MSEKTFTEALKNLQTAADELSKQTTGLEASLSLFEEGMKEAEYCRNILKSAEQRIITFENGEENA